SRPRIARIDGFHGGTLRKSVSSARIRSIRGLRFLFWAKPDMSTRPLGDAATGLLMIVLATVAVSCSTRSACAPARTRGD
ncbi:MAG: hypothetical protein ACRERC_10775, partial [Candidatus Binatia bacterium]